jgi:hypothetical protein
MKYPYGDGKRFLMRGALRNYDGNGEAHERFFSFYLRFGGRKGFAPEATFFIHTP